MDGLRDEARYESPWALMFTENIVICAESGRQEKEKTHRAGVVKVE